MATTLLDGATIAQQVYSHLKQRIRTLRGRGCAARAAAILIGENSASGIYVKNRAQACSEVGVYPEVHRFAAECRENEVLEALHRLNANLWCAKMPQCCGNQS